MSKDAALQFYQAVTDTEELQIKLRAMTTPKEMIKLAKNYGYCFTLEDLAAASNSSTKEEGKDKRNIPAALSNEFESASKANSFHLYHYEFELSQLQGFEQIGAELENLKIKPPTVDLDWYEKCFREDDFNFASVSPASPEFKHHYEEMMRPCFTGKTSPSEPEYTQRHFHLVNLDLHVNHGLYEDYFTAKVRTIGYLEKIFKAEIRFSGSLWYPPNAYRAWHTNENQPGWRMYIIDFDGVGSAADGQSFFRYMNPENQDLVTLGEKRKIVRFFKIEQAREKLFWHCIVNGTKLNRWSFGFVVPDNWMEKLAIA